MHICTSLLRLCEQAPVCRADVAARAHLQRVVRKAIELGAAQAAGGVDALLGWVCLGRVHQQHVLHEAGQSQLPQGSRSRNPHHQCRRARVHYSTQQALTCSFMLACSRLTPPCTPAVKAAGSPLTNGATMCSRSPLL
jgi:hypothetical protein